MTKRKKLKLAAVAPGCALFLVAVVLAAVFLAPQFTERHFKVKQEVIEPIAAASELPQMFGGAAPVSAVSLSPAVTGWGCSRIQESDVYELAWVSGQSIKSSYLSIILTVILITTTNSI